MLSVNVSVGSVLIMSTIGRMGEFNPHEEEIESYVLRLKHYFKANNVKEDNQVSVLITVIGPKTLSVLSDLVSPDKVDDKSYDTLKNVLEKHFSPKRLVVAERFNFYSRVQRPNESIADFVVALKHLSSSCKFSTFLKDALRDKLICGIHNESIRQKLLSEEQNFDKTFEQALMLEQADRQTGLFTNSVHMVNKFSMRKVNVNNSKAESQSTNKSKSGGRLGLGSNKCFRCGNSNHIAVECPYKDYKCHTCKKVGHLSKSCFQVKDRPNSGRNYPNKSKAGPYKVHQLTEEDSLSSEVESMALYNIGLGLGDYKSGYKVRLAVENRQVTLELDTGCALTLCPIDFYEKYFYRPNLKLKPCNVKLLTYSGSEVRVIGQLQVNVTYGDQSYNKLPLVVVDIEKTGQPMLLGRNWLEIIVLDWKSVFSGVTPKANLLEEQSFNNLNLRPTLNSHFAQPDTSLVKSPSKDAKPNVNLDKNVVSLKKKYSSVFQGKIGTIKDVKANIILKEGAVPKFCKFRPVPFALRKQVEEELDKMIADGVAYPVTSSEWATPLVVVPKPSGVRLCGDYKVTLNQVIQTEHYPLPQPEDIFATLSGCNCFSVVDLQTAYLQLKIAETSQDLLTLATHRGLVRLTRLPFGLSSAPALFQAAIDEIIKNLPGTVAYLDDVIVAGSSYVESVDRLEKLLQRFQEYGVKVNESKCKFLQPTVDYLGYRLSAEGISPQENIIEAIRDAPEPSNKDELRSYLGLVNYYGRFICNLSDKLNCFYSLLKKDEPFNWTKTCSETFQKSKHWVLSSDVLVHYDVKKPLVLTCDASPRGVGAVLSHLIDGEERPIAFASKTLSASEKNYSQLHREALALVFGAKKFHKYIYGQKNVLLQTDHQPLAVIFGSKRGTPSLAAARLQRWALILSAYDFQIKYRKGSDVPHADALSRLPLPSDEPLELESNYISHVEECIEVFNCFRSVSDEPLITSSDVAKLTSTDPILSKVRDFVWHGWRESYNHNDMLPFVKRKDELSVDNNCLLWGTRTVIPSKLREQVARLLHDQHPGITRMKLLARSYVWWPGIEQSIETAVSSCTICQSTRNAATKVPLQQWPRVSGRWQRVHIDFAEDSNTRQQMLVLVDSFSKWIEVFVMKSTSSLKTIERLRTLFATFGLPESLVSDNGTSFTSVEFKDFLSKNGIRFILTPPYHAASNGAAERCVQEVKKNLLRQVLSESSTGPTSLQHKLDNFLFAYRNTPNTVTGLTPAELFLNFKPRTKLALLKPNLQADIDTRLKRQKENADRHRGLPRSFEVGEKVQVKTVRQEKISWVPGKILEKKGSVIYLVSVLGSLRRCHADHLRPRTDFEEEELEEVTRSVTPLESPRLTVPPPQLTTSPQQPMSPSKNTKSPPKEATRDDQPEVQLPSPVVQCRPPTPRKSGRTVRKPDRLNL